jgi:hypothetical protein
MKIIITKHASQRLKSRKISKKMIESIVNDPDEKYYDTIQQSNVAIKKILYGKEIKKIGVYFHYENLNVKIHTVHPERKSEIINRVKSGRYIKK